MKTLETITFAAAASALILISTNVSAALDTSCYEQVTKYDEETRAMTTVPSENLKDIHIDVKRPQNGKTNVEYVYDASNSKTPSGKAEYRWERQNGGFELLGPTDQATVTVKAEQSEGGVNTYTLLTVSDPVCERSSRARIDVSYYQ